MNRRADAVSTQARAARAEVEAALEANGWPWSRGASRLLDLWLALEECMDADEADARRSVNAQLWAPAHPVRLGFDTPGGGRGHLAGGAGRLPPTEEG
jgi:hypothetical protein